MPVDTEALAAKYRAATLDLDDRRLLLTSFRGSVQERDLSEPANCDGLGRIRHFRRRMSTGWPLNPLPNDPAHARLKREPVDELRAQVFQNAACNWRCWYCFVPFNLLAADPARSRWISVPELFELYLREPNHPFVMDLSGGQPELTPEWVLWTIDEVARRGMEREIYVWSDDNLSCDYFWRYLSNKQQEQIANCAFYGRAACFKGFDAGSFAFNTQADPGWFDRQFDLMSRLVASGMDVYGYVTLTAPSSNDLQARMRVFLDRLQTIDEYLPLRMVPLEVQEFTPVTPRLNPSRSESLSNQWRALEAWRDELSFRFTPEQREWPIHCVPLRNLRRREGVWG
jgi:uncharacterized Fe-S cluster-containing radical SAM superfamily protein